MEKVLSVIAQNIAGVFGELFFQKIVEQFEQVIDADFAFIAQLDADGLTANVIALVGSGKVLNNFSYPLKNTPCKDVFDSNICVFLNDVSHLFPDDQLLKDMGIEGYIGTPLHDSSGNVMGIVVALYKKVVVDKERVLTLFQLFSGRISGEFERISQEKKLVMLNESLDQQVKKRTSELEVALEQLKKTQKNLILNEKMASLGLLTTGIAHEINNPTSYTHTAIYMMNAEVKKIKDFLHQLAGGEQAEREVIQRIDEQFIALNELIKTATNGTLRIKNIVNDLRLFTRKENLNMKNIRLSELINSTVYLVRTQFDAISIVQEFTSDPLISCYPAKLSQVFMNIIANACQAIMAKKRLNQELVGVINIFLSQQKEEVKIVIKDNGLGMSEAIKNQMFDAFFTTKTEEEGTGLGMAISFDIIKEHQGRFEVYSVENEGSEIAIYLPYSITNKK